MNWIHFKDGPADGQRLELARAPKLLRVVLSAAGKWDALDQLDDTPRAGETIFVYVRDAKPEMSGFIDCRGRGGRKASGAFVAWNYRSLNEPPPDDAVLRETDRWREWCQENGPRLCSRVGAESEVPA